MFLPDDVYEISSILKKEKEFLDKHGKNTKEFFRVSSYCLMITVFIGLWNCSEDESRL